MNGELSMSDFTLTIPDKLYQRAQQIAEAVSQPVARVLLEQLQLWTDAVPPLDTDEEAELQALRYLSDDALWTIAREQMPQEIQARMQVLLDKNTRGAIMEDEYTELTSLVERGQRLMLRKSEAAALLTKRGYTVSKKDMAGRD
jgi:hypothetical protein